MELHRSDARPWPQLVNFANPEHAEKRMDISYLFAKVEGIPGVLPSQRAVCIRDGQEAYEILNMAEKSANPAVKEALQAIHGAMIDANRWNRDETFYLNKRIELGNFLSKEVEGGTHVPE